MKITKKITGYAIISMMILAPSFAFAKEGKSEGNNKEKNKSSFKVASTSSVKINKSSNASLVKNTKHVEDENEHHDNKNTRDDIAREQNLLRKCFVGFSKLTIADVVAMNLSANTTLGQICLGRATTTPPIVDTVAPSISSLTPTIGTSTVSMVVTTNEASKVKVFFSTSTVSTSSAPFVQSVGFGTVTTVTLTGLIPATAYNLIVMVTDAGGNTALSSNIPVTTNTLPVVDSTSPVLSSILTNSASTSVNVSWLTNELASSKIFFSTTTPVSTTTASFVENVSLVTNHILAIPGLVANTLYHFLIQSKDAAGNIGSSVEFSTSTTQ